MPPRARHSHTRRLATAAVCIAAAVVAVRGGEVVGHAISPQANPSAAPGHVSLQFQTPPPPLRSIDAPGIATSGAVATAATSVEQIIAIDSGCGVETLGSGWPVAADTLVTDAHVVAGGTKFEVRTTDGRTLSARLTEFDPTLDVAVLRVPGLNAVPLTEAGSPSPGSPGAVIGYPYGGPERAVAATADGAVPTTVSNIYNSGSATRTLEIITAPVHPGNSGGVLVNARGQAEAMVFGTAVAGTTHIGLGMTLNQLQPDIRAGLRNQRPVSPGRCIG